MKMSKKNLVKSGVSLLTMVAGVLLVNHAKDNSYGKEKVIKIATGATGTLLGLAGLVHVIDEELKPEVEEDPSETEDYGEDIEDDFFKDLEEELMDDDEKEVEDHGDEDCTVHLAPDEGLMLAEESETIAVYNEESSSTISSVAGFVSDENDSDHEF